ncbi:hypothetical protein QBC45DRAFT_89182 [Copromyces sp. CBS 386.78]|nr:hypothetical protein QBC45DRAFT_89182 [Copromyces sp. CBS 386.78]
MKLASWTAVPCTLQLARAINLTSPSQNMPRSFRLDGGKNSTVDALYTRNTSFASPTFIRDYKLVPCSTDTVIKHCGNINSGRPTRMNLNIFTIAHLHEKQGKKKTKKKHNLLPHTPSTQPRIAMKKGLSTNK